MIWLNWRMWAGLALAVALCWSHWFVYQAGRDRVQAQWDREKIDTERRHARDLQRASERADAAQVALDEARRFNAANARRMRSAVDLATGRECLSALIVDRLRNEPSDPGVPADPKGVAPGPRTGSGDREVITAIERLTQYAADCRAQVNAIRQTQE